MPEGLIVKALSGYYYVSSLDQDGRPVSGEATVQCRARGIFKKKRLRLLSVIGSFTN